MMKPGVKNKKTLGSALANSIGAEEKSVTSRFDRAEELFRADRKTEKTPRVPVPRSAEEAPRPDESAEKAPPKKKQKPVKVIRDSFTMPPHDYNRISQIIRQGLKGGISINKSEVVRAGLISLQKMNPDDLLALLQEVEKVKPGRPPQ
jgi:hypothetical protein